MKDVQYKEVSLINLLFLKDQVIKRFFSICSKWLNKKKKKKIICTLTLKFSKLCVILENNCLLQ